LPSLKQSDLFCYIQHAGEVYGERSILTTEARELQSRLQRLSEERNNYLDVIEEVVSQCFGVTILHENLKEMNMYYFVIVGIMLIL
jgi:hypothetical protein